MLSFAMTPFFESVHNKRILYLDERKFKNKECSLIKIKIAFYWIQLAPKNNKNYYCETCDKSFKTDESLYLHEAEHETCGLEGCEFTAHPKIIEKHIKMQHETGLYNRIGKLYSKEDIDKWIQERKKRYPSRKAIEEKKELQQKKIERGERIKPDENRFNKSFTQRGRSSNKFSERSIGKKLDNKERSIGKKFDNKDRIKKKPVIVPQPTEENLDWRSGIPPFAGIGKPQKSEAILPLEPEKDENFSDDEWAEIKATNQQSSTTCQSTIQQVNKNSLNLLACYNSDEESSDNNNDSPPEEVKTVIIKNQEETSSVKNTKNDGDNNNENLEISNEKKIPGKRKRRHNKTKLDRRSNFKKARSEHLETNDQFNKVQQRSLTLLEKLLSNEIRHERNVILQCVRYVVQNNFFQT